MKSKKIKVCSLILVTAVCSTLSMVPNKTVAATKKNGIVYLTKKDVKNGRIVIKDTEAKSIVVKSDVKKATIQLKGVKLSNELRIEKGDYILKTSRTKIKSIKISGKDTKVKLDRSSDLNKRNFVLKVEKNTTGNLDLSEFGKKIITELGKNSDINIKVGNNDKASVVVRKAYVTSKLELTSASEGASISKIRVESPVKLTVKVDTTTLETTGKAAKADITLENKVTKVKNEAGSDIVDKEAKRMEEEKAKEEKEKAEREKADKEREKKARENRANLGGGSSQTPSKTEKKATAITLSKEGGELNEDGKTIILKVTYIPDDATNKNLDWAIKEGSDKVRIISSSSNEAKIEALDNGAYKIEAKIKGSDVKAEISGNVTNQGDKAFEKRIDEYLKFTEAKINKDNYEDIKKMGDELVAKITDKINATSGTEKAKWEAKKNEVSLKKNVLDAAIDVIKGKVEEDKTAITNEYNKIKTGKPEANIAKEAVRIIEEKRKELSEKDFKAVVTDAERYNKIKAEVDKIKDLVATTLTVDENGIARIGRSQNAELSYKIIRTHTSMGAVLPANEVKIKAEGIVAAGQESFSLLNELRKAGLGWYKVIVYKKMNDIEDFTVADTYNAHVKVQLLENTLGSTTYEYDNGSFVKSAGTGKVRLNFEGGKHLLEWDDVPGAEFYDVAALLTFESQEKTAGAYMLKSSNGNDTDYSNIENETEGEFLGVDKHICQKGNLGNARRLCAVGVRGNSVDLNTIVPYKGSFVGEDKDFWNEAKDYQMAIDILIIPRSVKGLYVSDIEKLLKNFSTVGKNALVKGKGLHGSFKVKEFYEKFYGEAFPTTP